MIRLDLFYRNDEIHFLEGGEYRGWKTDIM